MALVFRSKAGADVLMLQADAERVLQALGREAAAEGIFLPEQVPAALQALDRAGAAEPMRETPDDEEADLAAAVDLARRAWPLVQLLRAAAARGVPVTWSRA